MYDRAKISDYLKLENLTNPVWRMHHKPAIKLVMAFAALTVLLAIAQSAGLAPRSPAVEVAQQGSSTRSAMTKKDHWASLPDREKPFWAREIVKTQLRDPGSAQFRGLRLKDSNTVCGEVNAKNGFGGYSGWQSFVVGSGGRTVTLDQPCP